MTRVRNVLIVEDDPSLSAALARLARGWCDEVTQVETVAEATRALAAAPPALLLVDLRLPDGSGFDVVAAACEARPVPVTVAMSGQATPEDAFRLAHMGVRGWVTKPFTSEAITRAIEQARTQAPPLASIGAWCVGVAPMREVHRVMRWSMVDQAIALTAGNRSQAAQLLRVSRQAMQQVLRARDGEARGAPVRPGTRSSA
jgi:DNA-binding NtrC family response regulator